MVWTPLHVTAFIFGILIIIDCFLTYLFKSKKITCVFKLIFDLLTIAEELCIYFATNTFAVIPGMVLNGVGAIRDVIFYFRGEKKWADSIFWLFGFLIIVGLSLLFTWAGPISLLPMFGTMIHTIALYQKENKRCKWITLAGESLYVVYYALLIGSSDFVMILNTINALAMLTGIVIGLVRIYKSERALKQIGTNQDK